MSQTVGEDIQVEIKRNQELLQLYKEIPTGLFGATMIQADIDSAIKALAEGDIIEILKAYERLKNNE